MNNSLPTAVVACIGGGSNAIGMFHAFVPDKNVRLLGVEAAGAGLNTTQHCAPLSLGTPGVLHGSLSMLMQVLFFFFFFYFYFFFFFFIFIFFFFECFDFCFFETIRSGFKWTNYGNTFNFCRT